MSAVRRMKAKLATMGESGVGKTSLIHRFVLNQYEETYIRTVGTRVSRIELEVPYGATGEVHMDLSIFDIVGDSGFRALVRETYYFGAHALMAIADLTRKESLTSLSEWIPSALEITGEIPLYLVLNKKDLEPQRALTDEEIRSVAEAIGAPTVRTSARTGESVEDAFNAVAIEIADRAFRKEERRQIERGLGDRILGILEKRGPIGLRKHQFFDILRVVKSDELQSELDRLEREGLVMIMWYGAADFTASITPRGAKMLRQASEWDEE